MKPFDQLTRLGKIRRQRKLVLEALKNYDLETKSVDFLADHTNTLFKITTAKGTKYAMRIYSDLDSGLKENQAEVFWLKALARDTNLHITEPIARQDGEYISVINLPGLPPDQRCVLMSWIPGKPMAEIKGALNEENYFKYGEALAQMHNHSATLNPLPDDINPKRWDRVFYYENEPIVYQDPAYEHLFPAERLALLEKIVPKANDLLAGYFKHEAKLILIHGDLHYWNVHLYQNELYLIDFEDLSFGTDAQDVAITLYYGREQENGEALRAAFKDGYSSIRPWPLGSEEELQTLIAARMIMFANYVAHSLEAKDAKGYLDGWFKELEAFAQGFC